MMSEPSAWMICLPTETHAPRVLGCTREFCGICAAEVWVSPEMKAKAQSLPGSQYVCMDCAPGVIELDANPEFEVIPNKTAPVCPGCGAVAVWRGDHWESEHPRTCSWLADPHSAPY
jgi:hypothetical protein